MERIYLRQFPGTRFRVKLVKEGRRRDDFCLPLTSPKNVYSYLRSGLEDKDREFFVSVLLDVRKFPLGVNLVSIGGLISTVVHPREVFKAAILASADALILAHNHPSGNPNPSPEDITLTTNLKRAGEILGISVLDHIIVGRNCFYSMKKEKIL